jgi:hypothetical protein
MAAYYLDVADARGVQLELQVEVNGRNGQDCTFVFLDPTDLILELEQSWGSSQQARYAGRLRAVRQQMTQVRGRHQDRRQAG